MYVFKDNSLVHQLVNKQIFDPQLSSLQAYISERWAVRTAYDCGNIQYRFLDNDC